MGKKLNATNLVDAINRKINSNEKLKNQMEKIKSDIDSFNTNLGSLITKYKSKLNDNYHQNERRRLAARFRNYQLTTLKFKKIFSTEIKNKEFKLAYSPSRFVESYFKNKRNVSNLGFNRLKYKPLTFDEMLDCIEKYLESNFGSMVENSIYISKARTIRHNSNYKMHDRIFTLNVIKLLEEFNLPIKNSWNIDKYGRVNSSLLNIIVSVAVYGTKNDNKGDPKHLIQSAMKDYRNNKEFFSFK